VSDPLIHVILVSMALAVAGAVAFSLIGLISGTDETTTIAPLTLLVVLLGAPPEGVLSFFLAAAVAKHITHAVPTALLGIPGDTMATALMREANLLRRLGVPHVALRKMVSGSVIAALIAVPMAVLFALLLSPFGDAIKAAAPWVFALAALLIAYFSSGRWASVAMLFPFVALIAGLQSLTTDHGIKLSVSYFLGIAVGPLLADLVRLLSPAERKAMLRDAPRRIALSPDIKGWSGYLPNPFKVLDARQSAYTAAAATVSSATFVFSPVAMTVVLGEIVGARVRHAYHRLTSVIAVRNGVAEATYIAETLIPLIAFGLPLSPVAVGPAAPLFNAPPRFTIDAATGAVNNLHTMLSPWQFLGYGLAAVLVAILVAYPLSMNYAHSAASFVTRRVSQEAIIAVFVGLVVMISLWEGGLIGLLITVTVGLTGGLLNRALGFGIGVQFMGFYMAVLTVPALLSAFA
jgi:TctA family transporter